jgi:hypothetical protein
VTVRELIERLQECDQDRIVVVDGYEGGYTELDEIKDVKLELYVNDAWYYGSHEITEDKDGTPALIFSR